MIQTVWVTPPTYPKDYVPWNEFEMGKPTREIAPKRKPGKPAKNPETRTCSVCGAAYHKPQKVSLKTFAQSKTCSDACRLKRINVGKVVKQERVLAVLPGTMAEIVSRTGMKCELVRSTLGGLIKEKLAHTVHTGPTVRIYRLGVKA